MSIDCVNGRIHDDHGYDRGICMLCRGGGCKPAAEQQPKARPSFDVMPDPTAEDLADPIFEAVWQAIKSWDVNVPTHYAGYCGANGSHVMLILAALRRAASQGEE